MARRFLCRMKLRFRSTHVSQWSFFLNVFTEFSEFREKIFVITVKGLELANSYVSDQDATTVPTRRM